MPYLDNGKPFPVYASEVKKLIGKKIRYLRTRDIDYSGRGYFFPKIGVITEVIGKEVFFDDGSDCLFSRMKEYEVIEDGK